MRADRRAMGLVVLLAAVASAEAPPPDVAERLEDCEGLPAADPIARHEPVGEDALHVVARSGERYLVFPEGDGQSCAAFAIGRAAARATGRFGRGNKVYALTPAQCGGGSCTVAIALRAAEARPIAALRTGVDCDVSVELRAIKLFPGRDSVELLCRNSSGAGWRERRVLIDAAGDTLAVLYDLDAGSYIALTLDERKAGECPSQPVGRLRVEKVAAEPLLRVLDPAWGELHDGRGTLPARQLRYDPARRGFVPTGARDIPTAVDARRACRRR